MLAPKPEVHLADRAHVELALASPDLAPPDAPASIGDGACAELRSAMARFTHGDQHTARRNLVAESIGAIDLSRLVEVARQRTEDRLAHVRLDETLDGVADLGYVVPTDTLASLLGVPESELDEVRNEVRRVAQVIGRGQSADSVADKAAASLLDRFDDHPAGNVATVSMLYQNHDATAALIASSILAWGSTSPRRCSLSGTVRRSTSSLEIGETHIGVGTIVRLDLEAAELEYGSGPHACPGQEVAESLNRSVLDAVIAGGFALETEGVRRSDDGRPTFLPLRRSPH